MSLSYSNIYITLNFQACTVEAESANFICKGPASKYYKLYGL